METTKLTKFEEWIEVRAEGLGNYAKSQIREIGIATKLRSKLEELDLAFSVSSYSGISFYHLEHAETVRVIQTFPGKWNKTYNNDSVNYTNEEFVPKITVSWSKPPENCEIVEEEVEVEEQVIPKHTEKKKRIVCKKPEDYTPEQEQAIDEVIADAPTTTSIPTN